MTILKCGLIYDFRNPTRWRRPWTPHYRALLGQIRAAEDLGFDEIWLTEHHFADDGYSPALFPIAAAIAASTETIRIGTNALLAALHHPLRVAEDAAVVDILSGGRLDLGLTLGFREIEYREFGLDFAFERRRQRLSEVVHALRTAYTPETGKVAVSPPSIQEPHPPIYIGANAPSALRALAPLGFPLILIGGPEKLEIYRKAQAAAGLDPASIGPPLQSLGMFLYVGKNSETAWEAVRPHARYVVEQDLIWSGRDPRVTDEEVRRYGIFGGPEDVAEQITRKVTSIQPSQVCFFANPPGMDPVMALESLALFARHVRPLLDAVLAKQGPTAP